MARLLLSLFCLLIVPAAALADERPNMLWICVDDMSDWLGCYGDKTVETPSIDSLAAGGVRFDRAYMPAPVCSTTRSALMIGAMQTTYGLHQHRTMIKRPLPEGVTTVPELLRKAGYTTFNEAKDDYNFLRDRADMYSPEFERPGYKSHLPGRDLTWLKQLQGQKFFGQIQLAGGKWGGETGRRYPATSRVQPGDGTVPPQYRAVPVFRNAIARHYEQIAHTDEQVGAIITALKKFGLWENTVVFFFTDHGCPLPRSKQFLYEEGLKVPLIVHWPLGTKQLRKSGETRNDLVNGIDISATTLALAGIAIPPSMEGRDLFAQKLQPPEFVVSARDRLGIAVDRIRTIRTDRFRYIRNYQTDRALFQPQYRQEYATFAALRKLLAEERLSPLQASYHWAEDRPSEELYDVSKDPHQLHNLAGEERFQAALEKHRAYLKAWEDATGDQGRVPESKASLELVFDHAKGKCFAPEFDFLKGKK